MGNSQQSTVNKQQNWIEIGKIVAAQGIKGELRVHPNSDFPERFTQPGTRWIKGSNQTQPQPIELIRGRLLPGKSIYVVKLEGISDRTTAETLRGAKLFVPESDRPELQENEYHVADLIGLNVIDQQTGETVGTVTNIFTAGNDLLEVSLTSPETSQVSLNKKTKGPKVLIPFVAAIVPVVDTVQGYLEINPPAGLLEINQ